MLKLLRTITLTTALATGSIVSAATDYGSDLAVCAASAHQDKIFMGVPILPQAEDMTASKYRACTNLYDYDPTVIATPIIVHIHDIHEYEVSEVSEVSAFDDLYPTKPCTDSVRFMFQDSIGNAYEIDSNTTIYLDQASQTIKDDLVKLDALLAAHPDLKVQVQVHANKDGKFGLYTGRETVARDGKTRWQRVLPKVKHLELINDGDITELDTSFLYGDKIIETLIFKGFFGVTKINNGFLTSCTNLRYLNITSMIQLKKAGFCFAANCPLLDTALLPQDTLTSVGRHFMRGTLSTTALPAGAFTRINTVGSYFMAESGVTALDTTTGQFARTRTLGDGFLGGSPLKYAQLSGMREAKHGGKGILAQCPDLTADQIYGATAMGSSVGAHLQRSYPEVAIRQGFLGKLKSCCSTH